jgi:hypothetical protein
MRITLHILLASLVGALAGGVVIGCKSVDRPASGSFASVRIQGHTSEQIRAATAVVFQQDGYAAMDVHHAKMVFEKTASRWDRIAYGNWIDEAPTTVRVRVLVFPVSNGVFDLRCEAFSVRHKGEATYEEEVRLKKNRSEPYQALLEKVVGRLAR